VLSLDSIRAHQPPLAERIRFAIKWIAPPNSTSFSDKILAASGSEMSAKVRRLGSQHSMPVIYLNASKLFLGANIVIFHCDLDASGRCALENGLEATRFRVDLDFTRTSVWLIAYFR
jgi:hypothetical protein